jgi:hypothetical protein
MDDKRDDADDNQEKKEKNYSRRGCLFFQLISRCHPSEI